MEGGGGGEAVVAMEWWWCVGVWACAEAGLAKRVCVICNNASLLSLAALCSARRFAATDSQALPARVARMDGHNTSRGGKERKREGKREEKEETEVRESLLSSSNSSPELSNHPTLCNPITVHLSIESNAP